jgi:ESS family glutamate:Na+ symporter
MIVKAVLNLLRKKKIMKRKYINNFMQNRIAGLAFDVMIAAGIMSINFGKLNDPSFWVLLALMSVFGTIVTYYYINFVAKRYFPKTRWYTFFGFFGMLTGTMSEGVALLREIDPYFETGVAEDLVNGSGTAALFGVPMLLITTVVYRGWVGFWVSFALLIVLFAAMILVLHFVTKSRNKKLGAETNGEKEVLETE